MWYIVAFGESIVKLTSGVNQLIRSGYIPIGGIQVDARQGLYLQAMCMEIDTEEIKRRKRIRDMKVDEE